MPKHGSVQVKDAPHVDGETVPRRSAIAPDALASIPSPDVTTFYELMTRSERLYGSQNALGYRKLLHTHEEIKKVTETVDGKQVTTDKKWIKYELSDYTYLSYLEFAQRARHVGSGLSALGLDKSQYFVIYGETSHNWQTIAFGCITQSITFATAYDSLGDAGIQHAINEPEATAIFTNANLLPTIANVIEQTPSLRIVIYDGEAPSDSKEAKAISTITSIRDSSIKVISIDELIALGKEQDKPLNLPTADDVATIMYTSGTTGPPKGVILTHKNIVSAVAAVFQLLGDIIVPGESYMAYLPLAHIMEFAVESCMLFVGAPIGYGTVRTLTDDACLNCFGDLHTFKPSIMVGVPAVWEKIRKGIQSKAANSGIIKNKIFETAVSLKKTNKFLFGGIADAIVFNAVKTATGGRLKYALSGGAALSKETQEFINVSLLTLIQGYGLTECSAMLAILPPSILRYESVGVPSPAVEVKLRDFEEAGYLTSNNPPQGEVLVKGNAVTPGYFKRDDLTKESFTEDGWFATGDIGQWNSDGTLSLIDRKKNLIKLAGGEYVALERLESIYRSSSLVENICVHADSNANQPMAIIFPHESNLRSRIKQKKLTDDDASFEAICHNPAVVDEVLKDANAKGKAFGFKRLEILSCVILTEIMWTPQNALATAAQKLNRKNILNKYKDEIKKVYP